MKAPIAGGSLQVITGVKGDMVHGQIRVKVQKWVGWENMMQDSESEVCNYHYLAHSQLSPFHRDSQSEGAG